MSSAARPIALRELQRAEVGVGAHPVGIQLERLFDLVDRAVEVLEPREGVSKQDLRVNARRVGLEHARRARLGVFEASRQQEQVARFDLRVVVRGQQIGRPDLFPQAVADITDAKVAGRQLESSIAESWDRG